MSRLPRRFFARPTVTVARELLGQRLVRLVDGRRLAGIITETEAYTGPSDLACHARAGRTPRTAVMYGPPGVAYVYFNYGLHWMLNVITEPKDRPAAVLIRGLIVTEGEAVVRQRRGRAGAAELAHLTDGPAKLAQALGIDRALNGQDLCAPETPLFIERAAAVPAAQVRVGPRVGLGRSVPEPWLSEPWNFRATAGFVTHILASPSG
ncbi:MAG: DNA-3-methyladenine glycosylase [Anaerolineales bacterium]|nr:DNA-3-methyladenine glycosylase [Anaerolineales bacterium]